MTCLLSIEFVLHNIHFCTCFLIFCMCLLRTERSGTPMLAEEWPLDSSHSAGYFLDFSIPSAGLYKLFFFLTKHSTNVIQGGEWRGLSGQGSLLLCRPPESDSWAPRQKKRTDSYELLSDCPTWMSCGRHSWAQNKYTNKCKNIKNHPSIRNEWCSQYRLNQSNQSTWW